MKSEIISRSLNIYPNEVRGESKNFVSVSLCIENYDELVCEPEVQVGYRFEIRKQDVKIDDIRPKFSYSYSTLKELKSGRGRKQFIEHLKLFNPMKNLILNGKILITCEVNFPEFIYWRKDTKNIFLNFCFSLKLKI